MEVWQIIAIPVVSALSGLITTGIVMTVGGMGVISAFQRRLLLLEERIEDTDTRITREVKRRAADAAVEAKKGSARDLAESYLQNPPAAPRGRPSIIENLVRKG